jgi:hypothetical protein
MEGFVNVKGTVEPRALAGAIATDAHHRVAEAVALTIDHLEEDGRGLNEMQKIVLVSRASLCLDGFEASVLADLAETFERIQVREPGDV